jgi:hypothetical protein
MTKLISPHKTALEVAFDILGPNKIARICGVKGPSACKWKAKGRLPRTEWTGETNYAAQIAEATKGVVSRDALLTPGVATK